MFYNMLIRSLDRNPQNSGEVFQNAKIRVWGRFQNVWKNIHPCYAVKVLEVKFIYHLLQTITRYDIEDLKSFFTKI